MNAVEQPARAVAAEAAARPAARPASSRVARAYSIEDLRALARKRLPRAVFDFFDGGAEDEGTLRDNRAAFERVRLLPKVLVDVSNVDTRTSILGGESSLPIAIAPTGAVGFVRTMQLCGTPTIADITPDLVMPGR